MINRIRLNYELINIFITDLIFATRSTDLLWNIS